MNKLAIGAVVVAALAAGGGYVVVQRTAQSSAMAAVEEFRNSLPAGYVLTHGGIEASAFSRGVLIRDVAITGGAETSGRTFKAASLSIAGARETADGGFGADALELTRVTAVLPAGASMVVGTLSAEDAELSGLPIAEPASPADWISAIKAKTVTATGLRVADEEAVVTAGEMVFDGLDNGRIARLALTESSLDMLRGPNQGLARLATLEIGPVDLAAMSKANAASPVSSPLDGAMTPDRLELTGLEINVEGTGRVTIAEASFDGVERSGGLIDAFSARVTGMAMAISDIDDANSRDTFSKLGYETISFDAELKPRFDREAATFEIAPLSITLRNAGTIRADLALGNMPSLEGLQDGLALETLMAATVGRIEISYKDDSLVRRIMKLAADRQGIGEDEFVDNTIREIEAAVARWDGTFGRELASTLAAFLREPGELVVLAEPATPRTVGEIVTGAMFSPEQTAEDIGLTVDRR